MSLRSNWTLSVTIVNCAVQIMYAERFLLWSIGLLFFIFGLETANRVNVLLFTLNGRTHFIFFRWSQSQILNSPTIQIDYNRPIVECERKNCFVPSVNAAANV